MNVQEYIDWHSTLGHDEFYDMCPDLADPKAIGLQHIGNVELPKLGEIELEGKNAEWRGVTHKYFAYSDDKLTEWAKQKWPELKFVKAKIQVQPDGVKVPPHLDLLGDYLTGVCKEIPWLRKVKHSLEQPGIDICQMIVAMEDQVPGQVFAFSDQEWNWKKGDCIRINTWRALHWTENKSGVDRPMIKITGIKEINKKSNVIA